MFRKNFHWWVVRACLVLLGLFMTASPTYASGSYQGTWDSIYPGSASDSAGCQLCHASSTQYLNPYGKALCDLSGSIQERIPQVENADSDADPTGYDNITEINDDAQPGWTSAAVPTYGRDDCQATGNAETAPDGLDLLDPQPAPEICDNSTDDNGNGLVDCADPQCENFVGGETTCGVGACETSGNLLCRDGGEVDNCTPGTPQAEGPFDDESCSDSIDNDCDGLTDIDDPDCIAPPEICDNELDDNSNGLVDCADPQCDEFDFGVTACGEGACEATGSLECRDGGVVDTCIPEEPQPEGPVGDPSCSDSIDNDCNGFTDEADQNCQLGEEICDNGIDDNSNGLVDCADPQCDFFPDGACSTGLPGICADGIFVCQDGSRVCLQNQPAGSEGPFGDPTCSDGLDNDCNGQTDDADTGCQPETEICDDGIDNSGNGLIDCEDPACAGFVGEPGSCNTGDPGICSAGITACRDLQQFCDQAEEAGTEGPFASPSCNDGQDNDCDGLADMDDPDCAMVPEICDNGIDDNNNDLTDCEDPVCAGRTFGACDTGIHGICGDGILTCDGSQTEPVCEQDQTIQTEGPADSPSCKDGLDNDCDGLTDTDDPDCETSLCADGDRLVINKMKYNRDKGKLQIKGKAASNTVLRVINADTGAILAQGIRVKKDKWKAKINNAGSNLESISVLSSNGCAIIQDVETRRMKQTNRKDGHRSVRLKE